ncbi:MAG TPA: TetR/AcrR family transcriptional regulator [Steroidobacteraceae bacterium]|nr:TetR/AcrR family transcriptional regulator [Steroidobacteraceae bacterium]
MMGHPPRWMTRKLEKVRSARNLLPPGEQDPRSARSREALRRAFLGLLETKPLEQITIQEITSAAELGYVTFFRHHATKESLLNEIAADQIRFLVKLTLAVLDRSNVLRTASLALCSYVDEHRALWTTLLTGGAAAVIREEYIRLSSEVAETRTPPDSWLSSEIAGILVVSATIELLSWWLRQKVPQSIEQIAEIHERIIISPVMNAKKRSSKS